MVGSIMFKASFYICVKLLFLVAIKRRAMSVYIHFFFNCLILYIENQRRQLETMSMIWGNISVYSDSVPGPGGCCEESSGWRTGDSTAGTADASSAV